MTDTDNHDTDAQRRRFLSGAAALSALALAPGVTLFVSRAEAKAPHDPISHEVRWAMLVDTTRCDDGCRICVDACKTEMGWHGYDRPDSDPQWIRIAEYHDPRTKRKHRTPIMCQHCEAPTCVDVCPTGASFKRGDGVVLVDKHICIGCRYCMMACPYKARSFVHEPVDDQRPYMPRGKGTVEACTFCTHRIDQGRLPACVEACQADGKGAMLFGDLNDPDSEIAQTVSRLATQRIRTDLGLEPGVYYMGL